MLNVVKIAIKVKKNFTLISNQTPFPLERVGDRIKSTKLII